MDFCLRSPFRWQAFLYSDFPGFGGSYDSRLGCRAFHDRIKPSTAGGGQEWGLLGLLKVGHLVLYL